MHKPVLLNEVIQFLDPKSGEFMVDGTTDGGGHSMAILQKIEPKGVLLCIDWDKSMIESLGQKFPPKSKVIMAQGNYADIPQILKDKKLGKADGLVLDLGFSSEQLGSGRGFSFLSDEPLDMRYNLDQSLTAFDVVNGFPEKDLANIFWKFGEERFARGIARGITDFRRHKQIRTTEHLVKIIKESVPKGYLHGRIHPATKVFQALRIYVNNELENLEKVLKSLPDILAKGGRVVIISFHSLEDRLTKNYFREMKQNRLAEVLTKKPVTANEVEIKSNPRSRSAKLRAIKII